MGRTGSSCEAFCRGGADEGLPCTEHDQCPGGDCYGAKEGSGVPHGSVCGCQCHGFVGAASRAGALTCSLGVELRALGLGETCSPIGPGADILPLVIPRPQLCIPLTTELSTSEVRNLNNQAAILGPDASPGTPLGCANLGAGGTSGLTLTGGWHVLHNSTPRSPLNPAPDEVTEFALTCQ